MAVAAARVAPPPASPAGSSPPRFFSRVLLVLAAPTCMSVPRLMACLAMASISGPSHASLHYAAARAVHPLLPAATPPVQPQASGVRVPDPGFAPTSITIINLPSLTMLLVRRGAGLYAAEFLVPLRLPQRPTPSSPAERLELAATAPTSITAAPLFMPISITGMVTMLMDTARRNIKARFRGHAGVSHVVLLAVS